MPCMHRATPRNMLLAAPKLWPEKHLGLRSTMRVPVVVAEIRSFLVVVRSNCSLIGGG
jgi:hypothetical protein